MLIGTRETARLLCLDRKTVLSLARSGELPAFRVGRDWRFSRKGLEEWIEKRTKKHSRSALSLSQLQSGLHEIAGLIGESDAEVVNALNALEELHHITLVPEPEDQDLAILVHRGADPENPTQRILKRMLVGDRRFGSCPYCGQNLPRVLRPADAPAPTSVWTLQNCATIGEGTSAHHVHLWTHDCKCKKKARFLFIEPARH